MQKENFTKAFQIAGDEIHSLSKALVKKGHFLYVNRVLNEQIVYLTAGIMYSRSVGADGFDEELFLHWYQSILRHFITDLFIAIELEMRDILLERNIVVTANRLIAVHSAIKRLQAEYKIPDNNPSIRRILNLNRRYPDFNDSLDTLLRNIKTDEDDFKNDSKKLFKALRILRNKFSHSHPALSEEEKKAIAQSPLASMCGDDGAIVLNVLWLPTIAKNVIHFLEIAKSRLDAEASTL